MSRLVKVTLLVMVLLGLPVGMPMASMASCPQCVLPAGAGCLLVAVLAMLAAFVAPVRSGRRGGWLVARVHACLWARRLDHPPQALLRLA